MGEKKGAGHTVANNGGEGDSDTAQFTINQEYNITSATLKSSTASDSRTMIGIGEEVSLVYGGSTANWTATGSGVFEGSTSAKSVIYKAGSQAETAVITATDHSGNDELVAPSFWLCLAKMPSGQSGLDSLI
jgi:hypothetical protein